MEQQKQDQPTVADDPKAARCFGKRSKRPRGGRKTLGVTADLTVNVNGKETSGPVMVKSPREVSSNWERPTCRSGRRNSSV